MEEGFERKIAPHHNSFKIIIALAILLSMAEKSCATSAPEQRPRSPDGLPPDPDCLSLFKKDGKGFSIPFQEKKHLFFFLLQFRIQK